MPHRLLDRSLIQSPHILVKDRLEAWRQERWMRRYMDEIVRLSEAAQPSHRGRESGPWSMPKAPADHRHRLSPKNAQLTILTGFFITTCLVFAQSLSR